MRRNVSAEGTARVTKILVTYTEYEWWLIAFETNQVLCRVFADHEGLPTLEEVTRDCGAELAQAWLYTPPCSVAADGSVSQCSGVYVYQVASQEKQREVIIELPPIEVWISLEGCEPVPPANLCTMMPDLVLSGEEPLPNEKVIAIHGTYDGQPFQCNSDICKIPLAPTPMEGIRIEFWADSSYGDSSQQFYAQVRVVDSGVSAVPGGSGWYVDVISSQWTGAPLTTCARMWEAFPPLGEPPAWLTTPDSFQLISSEEPYYYLAGRLIAQGLVDVASCPSNGLLPNGYADTCGLERARPMVEVWQNQFDARIIEVAKQTGVPGQMLKNLFAQESQFWPGVFRVPYEFGLGQITDQGADVILLWNTTFYEQFCPLVLSEETCAKGYLGLNSDEQAILRGALALEANANCKDCPTGIDLSNANFTVPLFANTLVANCAQVSRTVFNATQTMPGIVASYEDLWRLTIANYHAGPGCTSYAIHQSWTTTQSLAWSEVSQNFTPACQSAVPYVDKITR